MVIHILWMVLLLFSIPIVLIYPHLGLTVLSLPIMMIILWVTYGSCFATDLEKYLRRKHGKQEPYNGTFSSHYLKKFLNIEITSETINAASYVLVTILSVIVFFK